MLLLVFLQITDRKKHLFVSAGGKNIAPAPIESLLAGSKFIEQIMLIGDKREFNAALIVPDYEAVRTSLSDLQSLSNEELALHQSVRDELSKEIDLLQKELASFERVRRFALLPEQFSVENGMMTPTLKVKRKEVESRYGELIDSLYKDFRTI